ncbi:hypothetical protein RDWZM_005222 [Blomia tropicalis]|uniref:Uncharacterized protein n=1 Tax=Blomia tropicalis TaxID=40697 RepID=A0A9Q0M913_BLOTA|nr:hypothetical protein RDWZM_005222 [Blomia tropicalis]
MVQIILIVQVFLITVQSFNLDTRIPVFKVGPKGSYFGYSVAEHVTINGRTSPYEPILLVGAPRASDYYGVRTGALYKCPMNSNQRDCTNLYVEADNLTSAAYSDSSDRQDQWLGVTVKSQGVGGYVMVCAHRYVHRGVDFRWGNGICYSLSQYLDYNRTYEPCRNRLVDLAHEQFGFCQAGTSGEISSNNEILIGSPGPYTWRGTIFANNIRYMGPVIEGQSPVSKYSYLGMSVTSGDFFDKKKLTFAGGAPRSNGTGQVILYTKNLGKNLFDLRGILQGEQFASSFGYSMTSLDCDGDGHSDLIVSAPFYYSKTEGGAVYQYLNKNLRLGKFDQYMKLTGKPESRFGFALANAGDLNRDGFQDLAVGAPYEKNGVVYIYLGSSNGLKSEPSQIIEADNLPEPVSTKTFGYSLSGNLDMDKNDYPDLLIGAYESDSVVLLRSRPIIKIKTSVRGNLTQIDPNSKGCPDDPSSKTACFSVSPCFKLLGNANVQSLQYRIEAETFTGKKHYRAIFRQPSHEESPNIVVRNITLDYRSRTEYCHKEVIYLISQQDIQNSIPFKLTYSLIQSKPEFPEEGDLLPDVNLYPILDQVEAQRLFYARFVKDCGSDDICESNLVLKGKLLGSSRKSGDNYMLTLMDELIALDLQVSNMAEPAYDPELVIEHSQSLSYVGRKISDSSLLDCKPETGKVRCSLSNPFKGKLDFQLRFNGHNIQDRERNFFIHIQANTTSKDKNLDNNRINFNTEIVRRADLELNGASVESQVRFGGEIKGETAMKYENEIGHKVYHKYTVKNHGPWRALDVSVFINWPIQLDNGRDVGKWILYITSIPSVQGGRCDIDSRYVNPHGYTIEQEVPNDFFRKSEKRSRGKREAAKIKAIRDRDGNILNVATLSCESGAKCIPIKCVIPKINPNSTALIQIPSRLWNATFVEEFSDVHHVSIKSFGEISLNPLYNIEQPTTSNDKFWIETKAFPDTSHIAPQASWWWYLVGILFGIIILTFIIILLYKTGFFKRERYARVEQNDTDTN